MTTNRTLREWRRHSLLALEEFKRFPAEGTDVNVIEMTGLHERILRLTQELSDLKLVRSIKN